ncbi:peptidase M16 [Ligilactobacillus salitolerans]|uniref:Peptidase M16 n=1 Tax=Ligilactobacillus salitolerans TaxID=1808352 RepID=A0A401ISU8_9LACO|nr:pitrilysin family protein [Ligilactobacillus salitolerans]GBG94599.1 peptidase M16 [Ligilactobacillus salitolerans]
MKKIAYPQFKETLFRTKLDNGLTVNLLPRTGFHKNYAILTINYGAIDTVYHDQQGKEHAIPAGTAHFLEHKLFEKEDHDAFDIFGDYGADANAFTSFTKTSFMFSTTSDLKKCLNVLLDFVQEPYFSEQTVEKEKGIIGEEISMYDDDVDWQLFFGMLRNLYPQDPLNTDIAGTKETIAQINAQTLYDVYREFYRPENMDLFVVGGFDPAEVLETIASNQAGKEQHNSPQPPVQNNFLAASGSKIERLTSKKMNVTRPKSMVGVKGLQPVSPGKAGLKYKLSLELGLYLLFGESSQLFQELYQAGIVDDSFSYELEIERGYHFAVVSADTAHYQEMEQAVVKTFKHAADLLQNAVKQLALAKKEYLGQYIQAQNSLESIANSYEGNLFGQTTVLDQAALIQEISLADVLAAISQLCDPQVLSIYRILPEG